MMKALAFITIIILLFACGNEAEETTEQKEDQPQKVKKEVQPLTPPPRPASLLDDLKWLEGRWVEIDKKTGQPKGKIETWSRKGKKLISKRTDKDMVKGIVVDLAGASIEVKDGKIRYAVPAGFQKKAEMTYLELQKTKINDMLLFALDGRNYPSVITYKKLAHNRLKIDTEGIMFTNSSGTSTFIKTDAVYEKQLTIEDVKWLEGHWAEDTSGGAPVRFHEEWDFKVDRLIGNGSIENMKDGTIKPLEQISIEKLDGILHYSATVSEQNNGRPVYFKLHLPNPDSIEFRNMAHDFPQQIIYVPKDEGKRVEVTLMGLNKKGENVGQKLNLIQQKNVD